MAGDDIFVTKTNFNRRAIQKKNANSGLIKLNPIWTVSRSSEVKKMC